MNAYSGLIDIFVNYYDVEAMMVGLLHSSMYIIYYFDSHNIMYHHVHIFGKIHFRLRVRAHSLIFRTF